MIDAPGADAPHPILLYVRIALLKAGPQDLPASPRLLPATVAAYVLVSLLLGSVLLKDVDNSLLLVVIDCAFTLTCYRLLLRAVGRPERFAQTAAALFGFQAVAAPVLMSGLSLYRSYGQDSPWQVPVTLLMLALAIWTIVVNVRIIRSATEWTVSACIGVVFALALLGQLLALLLQSGGVAT